MACFTQVTALDNGIVPSHFQLHHSETNWALELWIIKLQNSMDYTIWGHINKQIHITFNLYFT